MAEICSDSGEVAAELCYWENDGNVRPAAAGVAVAVVTMPTPFTVSRSFKEGKSFRRVAPLRPSLDADEFINLLHGSDPVNVELHRLENEVRDKDRELGKEQAEMKALRLLERLTEKAVE